MSLKSLTIGLRSAWDFSWYNRRRVYLWHLCWW